MKTNNLGHFADIDAVWAAYPEGGREGDYLTVGNDNVEYEWNKYDVIWENSATYTESVARETTTIDGDLVVQNNLTVAGTLRAKRVKQPNLGLFASLEALMARYPHPEVGMWATVGQAPPAEIWACAEDGVWYDTGKEGGLDAMDWDEIGSIRDSVDAAQDAAERAAEAASGIRDNLEQTLTEHGSRLDYIENDLYPLIDDVSFLNRLNEEKDAYQLGTYPLAILDENVLDIINQMAVNGMYHSYCRMSTYGVAERIYQVDENGRTIRTGADTHVLFTGVTDDGKRVDYFIAYEKAPLYDGMPPAPGEEWTHDVYNARVYRLYDGELWAGYADFGRSVVDWEKVITNDGLTAQVEGLLTRIGAAESDIDDLERSLQLIIDMGGGGGGGSVPESLINAISELRRDLTALSSQVTAVADRVSDNESDISDIEDAVALLATKAYADSLYNTLNGKIAALNTSLSGIADRVTALENADHSLTPAEKEELLAGVTASIAGLRGEFTAYVSTTNNNISNLDSRISALENAPASGGSDTVKYLGKVSSVSVGVSKAVQLFRAANSSVREVIFDTGDDNDIARTVDHIKLVYRNTQSSDGHDGLILFRVSYGQDNYVTLWNGHYTVKSGKYVLAWYPANFAWKTTGVKYTEEVDTTDDGGAGSTSGGSSNGGGSSTGKPETGLNEGGGGSGDNTTVETDDSIANKP